LTGHGSKTDQGIEPIVQQALVGRTLKGVRESKDSKLAVGFVHRQKNPTKAL